MRTHTAEVLDISGFVEAELKPERTLPRNGDEIWRSRVEPLDFLKPDGPLAWSLIRSGDLVRIPLIPYRVEGKDPAMAMLVAMDVMQRYVEAVPNAIRTHIIVGSPVEDLPDDEAFRFWVGFAAQIQ